MSEHPHLNSIFNAAAEIESPGNRKQYLDEACGENTELKKEVERLLDAHFEGGSLLDKPAEHLTLPFDKPIEEQAGSRIGNYKLLEEIGEGGMGVVYMAEQTEPVERRVALKIIKAGMDSRVFIARFEAERQALALMDHPNIAKVLDAGTTESGRPYFVMELVRGVPITEYCDQKNLDTRSRLRLFASVLHAVQHAHQKGIIHRDLKPTNVMVAEYDDKPVPKVIDFGVAKATGQKLTEKTLFTHYGQLVGTLEYMSPEQAKLNQLDVDTRSDIYSLGVLLYELLTGNTPIEKDRLRSAAFDEMLRIIREEDPPRPSVRLSRVDTLAEVASTRQIDPQKLLGLVRGELDWIVMKALSKDRSGRYETASNFADDVERYLSDETVEACPPTVAYRLRKFARRNKAAFAGILALAGIAVISAFAAMQFHQVAKEKEAALLMLQDMDVHWYKFEIPKSDPNAKLGLYTVTSDGQREFVGGFTAPGGKSIEGWIILDIVDQKRIRARIQVDYAAYGYDIPTPLYPFERIIKEDGSPSNGGTSFRKAGSVVSPGDILIRFSREARFSRNEKEVLENNVGISFGFE